MTAVLPEAEPSKLTLSADGMDVVHVSPRVLDRMKRGAVMYLNEETGEAVVGVMQPPPQRGRFPLMYLLETIPPRDAIRQWAMFSQGDDWQGAIFNWLNENWEVYRELRRRSYGKAAGQKWDLPLLHLGDWHKQPGMVQPSGADFRTAKQFLKDNQQEHLIAPIVTFVEETDDIPVQPNTLLCKDVSPGVRIDFWGIGRKDRAFIPLKPVMGLGYGLPRLPEAVWWLDDSVRMDLEINALEKDGLTIMDIAQYNADGMPPLETCFVLYRPGAYRVLIAITPHTYPKKAPLWRTAPIVRPEAGQSLLEAVYKISEPVSQAAVADWSGDTHALIDGVKMVERSLA